MQTQTDLIEPSLTVLRDGQAASGAFLASPSFPVYRYSWFRDGTFIAQALDLWGDHARARRFYDWGVGVVLGNAGIIRAALSTPPGSAPERYLHTRYTVEGAPGDDDWPNFQLDGFGTFLWGMMEHLETAALEMPLEWETVVDLLAAYLLHLWRLPNFDCWEEHPDRIHVATLCALYGGLSHSAACLGNAGWKEAAEEIRDFVLGLSTEGGYLPKFVGTEVVDAGLLWACIPYGLLAAADPIMQRTVARIESELLGPHGGVHRYAGDSYYGGGAWILLTASLGEYYLCTGDRERAAGVLEWIERQASPGGALPEQVPLDLNQPEMYRPWVESWGPIACPLLWSHAAYLRLKHALKVGG